MGSYSLLKEILSWVVQPETLEIKLPGLNVTETIPKASCATLREVFLNSRELFPVLPCLVYFFDPLVYLGPH